MKVALVVQRYGQEICGGAEQLCRQVAERMAGWCEVEVLTTCAQDYMTWQDAYEPGLGEVNGVPVRRFPVDYPRTVPLFNRLSEVVFSDRQCLELEARWVREQGPYSSDFFRFLAEHGRSYDAFIFFTYAYGLTFFGLPMVAARSLLVPTAHDEPALHLPIYRDLFAKPRGWLFNSVEEKELVLRKFNLEKPNAVIGIGIDMPELNEARPLPARLHDRLRQPFLLYLGRVDESKGCRQLCEYFLRYRNQRPTQPMQLALVGKAVMKIPAHRDIVALGYVEEEEKVQILASAALLVMPSPYESLSMVTLEAWSVGTPALVNGKCEVLRGQCRRSGGGVEYVDYQSFEMGLTELLANPACRLKLGESGRNYVQQNYSWPAVERKYMEWAEKVARNAF